MGKTEQETRRDEINFIDLELERSTFPFKVKWGGVCDRIRLSNR